VILLLLSSALAGELLLSTGGQLHPAVAGQPSAWALGWGQATTGPLELQGYSEFGTSGLQVYVLTAEGDSETLSWTLGRQRLILPTQPRLLDGAELTWRQGGSSVEVAAGRLHVAGGDSGTAMARAAVTQDLGPASLRTGLWAEQGELSPQLHPELRLEGGGLSLQLVAALADGQQALEQARAEWRSRPAAGVDLGLHLEHREAPPISTASSPDILTVFSPEGLDEAGALLGISGRSRGRVLATATLRSWERQDLDRAVGASASLGLRPSGPDWTPRPSWRMATGPLGTVHSFQAVSTLPTPQRLRVDLHGGVAPYHQPLSGWETAWWGGTSAALELGPARLRAGGELGRSKFVELDRRAWAALEWSL
jgi:hypothetical protein